MAPTKGVDGWNRAAHDAGVPRACVLADAGYGVDTEFRDGITELGMGYVVGIQSSTSLWSPGVAPLPSKPWSGRGRPTTRLRRTAEHKPVAAKALAQALPEQAWQTVTWREGSNAPLSGRFAAVRVRPAHRDTQLERDYRELKQEIGLGHYEGRGWRDFHHHATLCIAAYGFLICERSAIPPSAARNTTPLKAAVIPEGFRPRGSPDTA